MLMSTRIKFAIALWSLAEIIVFAYVVKLIGFPEALLVGFLTSLFGWTLLKRTGASAMMKLRAMLEGRLGNGEPHRFLDETLATFGALALLMPGFLSDLVGLALAVPAARAHLGRWIGGRSIFRPGRRAARSSPSTIDLDRGDWDATDPTRRPITKV